MKIKTKIIPKLHNVSRSEMRLLFFLVRRSNEADATVRGVYYKDVQKEAGIGIQSFYNALNGLQEKGIIRFTKKDIDYDVYIIDNEYPEATYKSEPYINLNMKIFYSEEFQKLKVREIYLMLEFLRRSYDTNVGIKRNAKEFLEELSKALKVTERVVRGYLHTLKEYFSIGIKDGLYRIRRKKYKDVSEDSETKKKEEIWIVDSDAKSIEMWTFEQLVRSECNRWKIQYTERSLYDTAELVQTYRPRIVEEKLRTKTTAGILLNCIKESVAYIDKECRELSAAFINKLMGDAFEKLPSPNLN